MHRHWRDVFVQSLRSFIDGISVTAVKNVIVSGHGGTLGYDNEIVVTRSEIDVIDDRKEGCFIKRGGGVIARYVL